MATAAGGRVAFRLRRRRAARVFTLLELIVAMALASLLVGLAVTSVGKIPVFVTIDESVSSVRRIFCEALTIALIQGRKAEVVYEPVERQFTLSTASPAAAVEGGSGGEGGSKPMVFDVPAQVSLAFVNKNIDDQKEVRFVFYPDGTGGGPAFVISYKGRGKLIRISPLSGTVLISEADDDTR